MFLSRFHNFIYSLKDNFLREFSNIFSFGFIRVYLVVLFLYNSFLWLFSYLFLKRLSQNQIILHYNVDFGADLFGDARKILTLPLLGFLVILFNFFLSLVFLKTKHFRILSHILLATALLVNIFLSLSLGPIYLINFR